MKENSIEEDIKIALDKFSDNRDIDSAMLIVEKFILGNYILLGGNRGNIVKDSLRYLLSDYKRILKENEILKEEKEQAWEEWNNIEQGSYKIEQKLKQQIKESQKENEELKSKNKTLEELLQGNLYELYKYYKELAGTYQGNSIPVQKIEDKIEELNKLLSDIGYRDIEDKQEREFYKKQYYQVIAQIKVLKELLKFVQT